MDALRRVHNAKKRELILNNVKQDDYVLDCGCGRGGDLHKWKTVGAFVVGVDPDAESLNEATQRAKDIQFESFVVAQGDVRDAVSLGPFDVVCYNFSIHYIFDSLEESALALAACIRPGGKLIGITPDEKLIRKFASPDSLGNTIEIIDPRHIAVRLVDGPFYAQGAKVEPMIDRTILEKAISKWFTLESWTPMISKKTGCISDIYSTFIFRRNTR